jgi:hypothetical protein
MARKITINEAMVWQKTLQQRHGELVGLRNTNSAVEERYYGANQDKLVKKEPVYDAKKLDATIGKLAREMRNLELAIKRTNQETEVVGYDQDDAVLGELE